MSRDLMAAAEEGPATMEASDSQTLDLALVEAPAPDLSEEPPAKKSRGRPQVRVASTDPMVLELEESEDPEYRGRSVAEPAADQVVWMISEDVPRKWWRACNPDFAAALEAQRTAGVATATFVFHPRADGVIYPDYKRTYIHDLVRMVQIDTDRHLTWPLRCLRVIRAGAP